MTSLIQDLRYGVRTLARTRAFTIVAVLTLALGIGANTAIFSVVNAVLLRPLPFPQPERIAIVKTTILSRGFSDMSTSMPDFRIWREHNQSFEYLAAYSSQSFNISGTTEPERVSGTLASADLFSVLGVSPARGRTFTAEEETFGKHQVVILSDALWERRFGANTALTEQTITLNGQQYIVVGVMPRGFQFPDERVALWTPLAVPDGSENTTRGNYWLGVAGRLKSGVSAGQAKAELDGIFRQLEKEESLLAGLGARVTPLHEARVGGVTTALLVLLAAVALVLLIACANVANLLLARAAARQREIAIRTALGASRIRLTRQLLTESLLLALAGGGLGLLLGAWGIDVLLKLSPNVPRIGEITIDRTALGFTFTLALLTSIVFGVVPSWQSTKTDLNETLKESGRSSTGGARRRFLRDLLVVGEVAISFVLLVGAGLMINSLARLQRVNPGFKTDRILTTLISLPSARYDQKRPELTTGFFQQLIDRVKALPGVEDAGVTTSLPLTNSGWGKLITIEDHPAPKSLEEVQGTQYYQVSPDYFGTLGIPILKGRGFNDRDTHMAPLVGVINETLARGFFGDEDPIGKRFYLGPPIDLLPASIRASMPPGFDFLRFTIVGVCGDVRQNGVAQPLTPEVYTLHQQELAGKFAFPSNSLYLAVRTSKDPKGLVSAIRDQVQELDREQPIAEIATMEELVATSFSQSRLSAWLLGIFAGLALILAAIGIYGLISYNVAQRQHEIGIRLALGAQKGEVLRLVIKQGFVLAIIGVALGLGASLLVTRVMASLLFEVSATDPLTFATIPVLLTVVALLASFIPARRATTVDPMIALRYE
jgi:putative ABC transport system permease protein